MRILHLSADYPDPVNRQKTRAIANLLALTPDHDHKVCSLNRKGWRGSLTCQRFQDAVSDAHLALCYPAPPMGVLHRRYLHQLADWILSDCRRSGFRPDAIHAHKLTVEGIAAERIATELGIPLIVSVQGNTDLKIALAKPGLRPVFRQIWQHADVALPFAPWARDRLDALLGQRKAPTLCLPCPGPADRIIAPMTAPPVIRTAFNLDDHRNKNAHRLIRAVGLAARAIPSIVLEIIGAGDTHAHTALLRTAGRFAKGHIRFRGKVANADMQGLLNTSAAFALVSHRESFGMVFAEALLAGAPCLIPEGRAIDGYLPNEAVTLSARPNDTTAIAAALCRLIREQHVFKSRLDHYQRSGRLDFMRRPAIRETYAQALNTAFHTKPQCVEATTDQQFSNPAGAFIPA